MTTVSLLWNRYRSFLLYAVIGLIALLFVAAIATPNLLRSRIAADEAARVGRERGLMENFLSSEQKSQSVAAEAVNSDDRMIVRKSALELLVDSPRSGIERAIQIVQQNGGYVVSSELGGTAERQTGTLTLRVPAAKFEAVRGELKKIAKNVESEQISSDDVTMQFAENEATLRNFRAEEASYLDIMKRSGKISDTLEVARQLSDVRGRIERMTAQIRTTQHQSEMAAIALGLRAEPVITGKKWRLFYDLQSAWENGVSSLASYVAAMFAVLLQMPTVLAWLLTIVFGGKLTILVVRRAAMFLGIWKPVITHE